MARLGALLPVYLAAACLLGGCSTGSAAGAAAVVPGGMIRSADSAKTPSYLYVANTAVASAGGQRIEIYREGDPLKGPVDTIARGVSQPDGIFVDRAGTLYVANADESGNDKVTVYRRGEHKPSRSYAGAVCAFAAVAATDGTVYVADACGENDVGRVIEYANGSTKPTHYLYPGGSPYCLALDAHDNLYVGYNANGTYVGQVKRYAPGAVHGQKLLPSNYVHFLTGVAVDSRGALLVANQMGGAIDVFTKNGSPPSRIIKTGQAHPFSFALDRQEKNLYVSYPCPSGGLRPLTSSGCGKRANTLVALDYASGKRLWTMRESLWVPMGVATFPSAPL